MENNPEILNLLRTVSKEITEIKSDVKQIKEDLKAQVTQINLINEKITSVEKVNLNLQLQINNIERYIRQNNIIIFGVEENNKDLEFIIDFTTQKLEVSTSINDINSYYRIGNKGDKPRPLVVKLISLLKKRELMNNARKLKGSGIYISDDLIPKDREDHKILREHWKQAKAKQLSAQIKNRKLIVNGEIYTAQDLKNKEVDSPPPSRIQLKGSSAPSSVSKSKENIETNTEELISLSQPGSTPPESQKRVRPPTRLFNKK